MSVPFFTIVTPVYNGEKYISKTIESIINQTYKNYDYIIIDGLSKDKSLEKIISYKKYITKIISEEDNGMYDAISKGFSVSRGKYLLWLNSDDILIDKKGIWHIDGVVVKADDAVRKYDVSFLAFHGAFGEDGKVQHFLESHHVPYTGSDSLGSAIGFNKILSKKVLKKKLKKMLMCQILVCQILIIFLKVI